MRNERFIEPEWLDFADPEDARINLAEIARLNKYFGGYAMAEKLLSQVARPDEAFSMLDLGAASGDTVRYLSKRYRNAKFTCMDINPVNIQKAPDPKLVGDAFALPFADKSFDLVFASLFLHHFINEQVVEILVSLRKLARRAVLISEPERHLAAYYFLPLSKPIFGWHKMTLHDGPASVQAGFTQIEMQQLVRAAGFDDIKVSKRLLAYRVALAAAVPKNQGESFSAQNHAE